MTPERMECFRCGDQWPLTGTYGLNRRGDTLVVAPCQRCGDKLWGEAYSAAKKAGRAEEKRRVEGTDIYLSGHAAGFEKGKAASRAAQGDKMADCYSDGLKAGRAEGFGEGQKFERRFAVGRRMTRGVSIWSSEEYRQGFKEGEDRGKADVARAELAAFGRGREAAKFDAAKEFKRGEEAGRASVVARADIRLAPGPLVCGAGAVLHVEKIEVRLVEA